MNAVAAVICDLREARERLGRRMADAERTLKAIRRAAADTGDNAYMARKVGLPLAETATLLRAAQAAQPGKED